MPWRWTEGGIAIHAGVLGTWPITVEIEEEEGQSREEEWNMEEEGLRRFSIKETI